MIPAMAMMASNTRMTMAVAGRTPRSYAPTGLFPHSVRVYAAPGAVDPHRTVIGEGPTKCRGPRMVAGAPTT